MPLTAAKIVSNLNRLASVSKELQDKANTIDVVGSTSFLIGQGPLPKVLAGFNTIAREGAEHLRSLGGTKPFSSKSDQKTILDAFTTFVRVHRQLLNIMIEKFAVLRDASLVVTSIFASIRQVEPLVDALAVGLQHTCPALTEDFTTQKLLFDETIAEAIDTYSAY